MASRRQLGIRVTNSRRTKKAEQRFSDSEWILQWNETLAGCSWLRFWTRFIWQHYLCWIPRRWPQRHKEVVKQWKFVHWLIFLCCPSNDVYGFTYLVNEIILYSLQVNHKLGWERTLIDSILRWIWFHQLHFKLLNQPWHRSSSNSYLIFWDWDSSFDF